MTSNHLTIRRLRIGVLAVPLLLASACGSDGRGDSEETLARDAIVAAGLTTTEMDCILDDTGLSALEYLDIDADDGSEATRRVFDAFGECVDADEEAAADDDGAAADEVADEAADEDAQRALVVASGLTDGEIDCILDTTGLSLDDLVALSDSEVKADGSAVTADEDAGVVACFGAGTDGAPDHDEPTPETPADDSDDNESAADQDAITSRTWDGDCSAVDGPCGYGDDADLDRLWDGCAAGNGFFCDLLYTDSPVGSEYEHFGNTCGERGVEASCEEALGSA